MKEALIITGWGWKEYAVAAAAALRALKGEAEVVGMSKRRLPEFLEAEGEKWKRIFLIGMSLAGDEARLAAALTRLGGAKRVAWVRGRPMGEARDVDQWASHGRIAAAADCPASQGLGVWRRTFQRIPCCGGRKGI